ncbi:MAG: hypothetical protein AAGC93_12285 [Cyanobacteria bacterium P01_F01_bin.53]
MLNPPCEQSNTYWSAVPLLYLMHAGGYEQPYYRRDGFVPSVNLTVSLGDLLEGMEYLIPSVFFAPAIKRLATAPYLL